MADAEPMALRKAGRPPDAAKHAAIHEAAAQALAMTEMGWTRGGRGSSVEQAWLSAAVV